MTEPAPLTCKELVELVTDYLEGTLPDPEVARLEEHLQGCDGCRRYLEQMRRTIRMTGMLSEDEVPAEGRDELLRVFQTWRDSIA
ncbi:MAG: anti-sigma factor [Candidatus Velamenicoccus archaeovorus]